MEPVNECAELFIYIGDGSVVYVHGIRRPAVTDEAVAVIGQRSRVSQIPQSDKHHVLVVCMSINPVAGLLQRYPGACRRGLFRCDGIFVVRGAGFHREAVVEGDKSPLESGTIGQVIAVSPRTLP